MSDLKDIEQKIEALEAELKAEVQAQEAVPEPTPVPTPVAPKGTISPIVQLAIDQAAERLKREKGL